VRNRWSSRKAAASSGEVARIVSLETFPRGKMSPLRGYPIVAFIFPWADAHGYTLPPLGRLSYFLLVPSAWSMQ